MNKQMLLAPISGAPAAFPKSLHFTRLILLIICCGLYASNAQAVPSFSRQTGHACAICHVQAFGPNLTPYGREFKLKGFPLEKNGSEEKESIGFVNRSEDDFKIPGYPLKGWIPPISAQVRGSFTNTDQTQSGGQHNGNNLFTVDTVNVFYGGHVFGKFGALAELEYSPVENHVGMENTDLRIADTGNLYGNDIIYGISLNNSPTVQDVWNTTPVWGYPFVSSQVANSPKSAALIDRGLAQQVGGATAYMLLNDFLYLEAGAYASFAKDVQNIMGTFNAAGNSLSGGSPYWRITLQHEWNGHYFAVGTYGLRAQVFPGHVTSAGTDLYTDLGADLTYQFLGTGEHIFELKGTYIREDQRQLASRLLGNAANLNNQLDTFRLNAAYTFEQTYGITLGYFRTTGSTDALFYPSNVFRLNRPNSDGFIAELDYVPFGKGGSTLAPWMNLRFALQYVAYNQFNGSSANYNGLGRNASDSNTLLLNSWIAF